MLYTTHWIYIFSILLGGKIRPVLQGINGICNLYREKYRQRGSTALNRSFPQLYPIASTTRWIQGWQKKNKFIGVHIRYGIRQSFSEMRKMLTPLINWIGNGNRNIWKRSVRLWHTATAPEIRWRSAIWYGVWITDGCCEARVYIEMIRLKTVVPSLPVA